MAQQIKKKYLADGSVDGNKIKILEGQSIKIVQNGSLVDLLKVESGVVKALGSEIETKSSSESKLTEAKSYTDSEIQKLTNLAPEALNTFKEISDKLAEDESAVGAVVSSVSALSSELAQAKSDLNSAISSESSARQSADSSLQSQITENASTAASATSAVQASVTAEATRAQAAEDAIASDVQDLEGYAQDIRSDLDQEVADRAAGDASTLASAKAYTDTAVAGAVQKSYVDSQDAAKLAEAKSYTDSAVAPKADSSYVDSQDEAKLAEAKSYADSAVAPKADKTYVDSQDSALSSRISVLESKPAVTFKQAKITLSSNLAYVDLPLLAIEDSIHAFVGRLAIHKDDDFSVSTAGGVTRLTFIGSLTSPNGAEKVEEGDVIRVVYAVLA